MRTAPSVSAEKASVVASVAVDAGRVFRFFVVFLILASGAGARGDFYLVVNPIESPSKLLAGFVARSVLFRWSVCIVHVCVL